MRLFRVLPILSLLFGARASSLDSRQLDAHPLDARDVSDSDVCTILSSGSMSVEDPSLFFAFLLSGIYDSCLCVSQVSQLLEGDSLLEDNGLDSTILTNFIIDHPPLNCNYPANSIPACFGNNPCTFTCTNGYMAFPPQKPTTCVCAAPNVMCNGNCVAPGACPSSQPTVQKRWVGSGSCTENGHGWAACGVFGGGARAWECVDTARDLESCGGCVLPLTPFSPIGQDCTSLPGVADVSCLSGECVVHRCMPGFSLSRDGSSCVSTRVHSSQPYVPVPEDDEKYMQALRYALEQGLHMN